MSDEPLVSRDIALRWTPALVKDGWVPVSTFFLSSYARLQPPITHAEAMFVVHLIRYKWDAAAPYPGFKTIATLMGVSPQAARGYARSLEQKRYLRREMQVGATNRFHFDGLFVALEQLMAPQSKAPNTEGEPPAPEKPRNKKVAYTSARRIAIRRLGKLEARTAKAIAAKQKLKQKPSAPVGD